MDLIAWFLGVCRGTRALVEVVQEGGLDGEGIVVLTSCFDGEVVESEGDIVECGGHFRLKIRFDFQFLICFLMLNTLAELFHFSNI